MLTLPDYAAIASASIVIRQLPASKFDGFYTELAAFTLLSPAFYHINFSCMLRTTMSSGETQTRSMTERRRQYHRAVAVSEMRRIIARPEATNQEVNIFAVLSLASEAVGEI